MSRVTQVAQFSYVITYRSDQGIRAANLCAVLHWLCEMRGVEVLLVEQDRTPHLVSDVLPPNCTHYFVYNDGPFNRSWGLNVGFKRSSGSVVGFGDADLVTDARSLMACYERCQQEFEAIKPYDQLVDLSPEESKCILDGNWKIDADRKRIPRDREAIGEFVCFCGGMFLMRRRVYEQLGGFDERFLGWGGEDDAMTSKLSRLAKRSGVVTNQIAYHLWHERYPTRYFHRHYQENLARAKWYVACDTQSLRQLCQQDGHAIGRPDKYRPGTLAQRW
jgi:hypothetical protein